MKADLKLDESDGERCKFCGHSLKVVRRIVREVSTGATICDQCLELCNDILEEREAKRKRR